MKAAVYLYENTFQEHYTGHLPEVTVRKGTSGCEDWILHQKLTTYIPGFGFIDTGVRKINVLHISMYGRLNEGLVVDEETYPGLLTVAEALGRETEIEPEFEELERKGQTVSIGCNTVELYQRSIVWHRNGQVKMIEVDKPYELEEEEAKLIKNNLEMANKALSEIGIKAELLTNEWVTRLIVRYI